MQLDLLGILDIPSLLFLIQDVFLCLISYCYFYNMVKLEISLKYENRAKHLVLKTAAMEYPRYLINQAASCFT
jgi:hypothetical protein